MEFPVVPGFPKSTQTGSHRFGKMVYESMVKSEPDGYVTDASQRDVVARQIDPLKPVAFLKGAEAAPLLFPIGEVRVHEIRDAPISAGSDGLRDQRIRWRFVPVLNHRHYVHQARLRSSFVECQLNETNQSAV